MCRKLLEPLGPTEGLHELTLELNHWETTSRYVFDTASATNGGILRPYDCNGQPGTLGAGGDSNGLDVGNFGTSGDLQNAKVLMSFDALNVCRDISYVAFSNMYKTSISVVRKAAGKRRIASSSRLRGSGGERTKSKTGGVAEQQSPLSL